MRTSVSAAADRATSILPEATTPHPDNAPFLRRCRELRLHHLDNRRLLLVQLPQFLFPSLDREIVRNRAYYAYPPTGLQTLKKAIKGRGWKVQLLDLNYELLKRLIEDGDFQPERWLELLDERLAEFRPALVGVSCISVSADVTDPGYHLSWILEHLAAMDRHLVVAGGPNATDERGYYLSRGLCHFVVAGEGENKFKFLLDALTEQSDGSPPLRGIHFLADGELHETRGAPDVVRVTGNLVDEYDGVPVEEYHRVGSLNPFSRMAGRDRPYATIQLNRGCRADCKFCGVTDFMGKGLRQAPVAAVIEELRFLAGERGVRHFEFLDDDLLGGNAAMRAAVRTLFTELVRLHRRHGTTWAAGNGLIGSSIDEELVELFRDSGAVGFRIGIESANPEMLKEIRKPANLELLLRVGRRLDRAPGVFVGGNYIIGFFGRESFAQMLDTFRFSLAIDLDWAAFSTFQFTSTTTAANKSFRTDGQGASEFMPVKDSSGRRVETAGPVVEGAEVFSLPPETIPSREQVKEIWFAFNLVANFLFNKNLRPGGNPAKLVRWFEALEWGYPGSAYLPLFRGVGEVLSGEPEAAAASLVRTERCLAQSEYWRGRFRQFGLERLLNEFPRDAAEAHRVLTELRAPYRPFAPQ